MINIKMHFISWEIERKGGKECSCDFQTFHCSNHKLMISKSKSTILWKVKMSKCQIVYFCIGEDHLFTIMFEWHRLFGLPEWQYCLEGAKLQYIGQVTRKETLETPRARAQFI